MSFKSTSNLKLAAKDVCENVAVVCNPPAENTCEELSLPDSASTGLQKSSKFEHHIKSEASKMKMLSDGFRAEKALTTNQELRRLQSNDSSIEERSSMSGLKSKMEGNGFSASKMAAIRQDQKQMQIGDQLHEHQSTAKASAYELLYRRLNYSKKVI